MFLCMNHDCYIYNGTQTHVDIVIVVSTIIVLSFVVKWFSKSNQIHQLYVRGMKGFCFDWLNHWSKFTIFFSIFLLRLNIEWLGIFVMTITNSEIQYRVSQIFISRSCDHKNISNQIQFLKGGLLINFSPFTTFQYFLF